MRKHLFCVAALVLLCSAAYGQPNKQQTPVERLKKQVRHELLMLPYAGVFDWLEAEVRDESTVVLRGYVVRPITRSDAESRVDEIKGVETVINEIEVLPLSPNDNRLRRAVYRALFGNGSPLFYYALAPAPSIRIIIKNGRCTLKGLVARRADSDYATLKARGVAGLFEVKNELQVEKDMP